MLPRRGEGGLYVTPWFLVWYGVGVAWDTVSRLCLIEVERVAE